MAITPLPPAPSRAVPSTFSTLADAFLAALSTFVTEANALETNVNAKEVSAAASAASALSRKTDAEAAAALAALTVGAAKWVSGTTYAIGNVVWSPTNYLSYRRKTNGAGTTDPSSDTTNWSALLPFSGSTKALAGTDTASAMTPADVAAANAVLAREPDQGVYLTAATSASNGISVADDDDIDYGTGNFFGVIPVLLADYTPSAEVVLEQKTDGTNGREFTLQTNGKLRVTINTTDYDSTVATGCTDNTKHVFGYSVTRETASTAGSIIFVVDGVQLGDAVAITAGAPTTINNAVSQYVLGTSATRTAGRVNGYISGNRALTAAEHLALYRNGIAEADKWGSQTAVYENDAWTGASGATPPTGWTNYASRTANYDIYDDTAGGGDTTTLKMTQKDAATSIYPFMYRSFTVTPYKNYELKFKYRRVDSTAIGLSIGTGAGNNSYYDTGNLTSASWVSVSSGKFVPTETTICVNVTLVASVNDQYALFDEIELKEIGATLALQSEGINANNWIDSTSNHLNATYPTTGWSLTRPILPSVTLTNLLTNSGFGVWSNGTAENVGSNLVTNGSAWTGASGATPPTGWAVGDAGVYTIFDSGDGAPYNVCLKLEHNTSINNPYIYYAAAVTIGKIYTLSFAFKHGTGTGGQIYLGNTLAGTQYGSWAGLVDVSWTTYTKTFEATSAELYFVAQSITSTGGQYELFDTVTLYEITPGCVAADGLGPNGMSKTSTLGIHREYGSAYISGLYGVKLTKGADTAEYLNLSSRSDEAWYKQFRGRTVTVGCYVYSTTATDNIKLEINDSDGTTASSFVGADALTWVEVTRTVGATVTSFTPRILCDGDTSDVAYASKPILIFGDKIGEGNYAPIPNEQILNEANIALTDYTATTSAADGIVDLEAQSSGKIPKGAKAVLVKAYAKDSAAGDGVGFDVQSTSGVEDGISVDTQVNNIKIQGQGWVKCDANGDIYFDHRGSGASALTVDIKVIGIQQ